MTPRDLQVPDGTIAFYIEGRERATIRLKAARDACDAAADLSYEVQAFVTRELVCAEAVAREWGVYQ